MNIYGEKERREDFNYFIDNYDKIFEQFGHKFIVIKDKNILGIYDSEVDAINATSSTYPIGSFIVQECNGDESGYTNYVSSWQLIGV